MRIGKVEPATTSICDAHADRIEVRGQHIVADFPGKIGLAMAAAGEDVVACWRREG